MGKRSLLLLMKPIEMYPVGQSKNIINPKVVHFLENRTKVHRAAVKFCQDVLRRKDVLWKAVLRSDLSKPINSVDMVVTVGGDGTLLQASHFLDDSIPVLGVNSDPTQIEQVQEFENEFDATRSTGYLCAATVANFEQILDGILRDEIGASKLSRISVSVNSEPVPSCALNDILMAHPSPATVSKFSFKIRQDEDSYSPLANCRSSGIRFSTAAGSTAAMRSAGGYRMPILSRELQYMVREPISPRPAVAHLMHGAVKSDQSMEVSWYSEKGVIFMDGSFVHYTIKEGDTVEVSSKAPVLQVFIPNQVQSDVN